MGAGEEGPQERVVKQKLSKFPLQHFTSESERCNYVSSAGEWGEQIRKRTEEKGGLGRNMEEGRRGLEGNSCQFPLICFLFPPYML